MKDLLAWFGLKSFPFDKNLKTQDVLETEPFKKATARLHYIKRRGGIMLLTGDPGVGKTLVLRHYVDHLNENLFKPYYTPPVHPEPRRPALPLESAPGTSSKNQQKRRLCPDPKDPA